jgi:demethylmenaquinone methyltransferase/2-methoxy-6-polyprenyl-1,4-benzoquinol methylase
MDYSTPLSSPENPSREKVWLMFDRIAPRYDRVNRLLSLGQDLGWRYKVAQYLPQREGLTLLDLATGTADQILAILRKSQKSQIQKAVGMDMSEKMLECGQEKIKEQKLEEQVELKKGDATAIPLKDQSVDVVTITFGIRNVIQVSQALEEMYRVLLPKGRALILEFSLPPSRFFRFFYLFYLRHILPRVGSWVSGDREAYRYLNKTIETFPHGEAFCNLMKSAHFEKVSAHPIFFGIATIYQGDRLSPSL